MDFGLGEIMFAAAMSTGMTVNAAYDVFNSFGLGKYFLNPDPYGTAGGFGTPSKRKRPAQDTTPPPSAKKPRIPKGQANTGRSQAVPIGLPPSVANPRPSKKRKTTHAKKIKKMTYVTGEQGTIKTGKSVMQVVKKPSKLHNKMSKVGRYLHYHSYGFKANTTSTNYKTFASCKATIVAENFYASPGAWNRYSMLNNRLDVVDPNGVFVGEPIANTGTAGGVAQTYANTTQYYYVDSIQATLHLKNMLNLPARLVVYWVTPKQNTRINPAHALYQQTIGVDSNQRTGQATVLGNTTAATRGQDWGKFNNAILSTCQPGISGTQWTCTKGVIPTDFPEWNKRYTVLKKDYINLTSGALVVHTTTFKYKKLFSELYAKKLCEEYPIGAFGDNTSDNPMYLKGLSIIPFISMEGFVSQADNGELVNEVTFGSFDVNVGFECKSKASWIQSDAVQPLTTTRIQNLIGAPQTNEEFINIVDADVNADPAT